MSQCSFIRYGLLMGLVSLLLGACAHVPGPTQAQASMVSADAHQWQLGGRFAAGQRLPADRAAEPVAGRFAWQHQSLGDTLWLIGPLGNALARVDISPTGVRWQDAAGQRGESPNLRALGESLVGVTLPDVAADAWLRGRWPVPDIHARDAAGQVLKAGAAGWLFEYRYGSPAPDAWPLAIEGAGPDGLWLRIALTEWNGVSDPAERPAP